MQQAAFEPPVWLRSRHVQSVLASIGSSPDVDRPDEVHDVPFAEDGRALQVHVARPQGVPRGTLLGVHGLAGCHDSSYMRWLAVRALARGLVAVRMNLRGCGGTEALSRATHNASQHADVGRVLEHLDEQRFPRPFLVAAFSLGGNMSLRHAGELGGAFRGDAIAALNPPIDLSLCCDALEYPSNLIYRMYFINRLCRLVEASRHYVDLPETPAVPWKVRTLRNFDRTYTAPYAGYADEEAYYADNEAGPWLRGVAVPTMILSAQDDPFVPAPMFDSDDVRAAERVHLMQPRYGGHCGYRRSGAVRFWAADAVLDFFEGTGTT